MDTKRLPRGFKAPSAVGERLPQLPVREIPVGLLLLACVLALALGLAATVWIGVALIIFALCVSVIVVVWARARSDILVTALAVLLFWAPFQITQTRFNISPQEVGVYVICVACALFDQRGVWQWVRGLLATASPFMRLALLIFVLACLQSFTRSGRPDLVASLNSFHTIVLYPVLFGLLIAYSMQSGNALGTLLKAFFAGAVAFAAFALSLKLWGVNVGNGAVFGRLGSESSFLAQYHPNNLALYFVLAFAFVPGILSEMIHSRRLVVIKVIGIVIASGVILIAVWLTFSRGALGALGLGAVAVLIIYAIAGQGWLRDVTIGVLGVTIGDAVVFALLGAPTFLGRFASLFDVSAILADPNVIFRLRLYQRAIEIASKNFVTGIGLQQFASTGSVPFSPHNTYLDLLVGAGAFGMLAFVIVLLLGLGSACAAAHHAIKRRKPIEVLYSFGFVMALIAFMVQALVETFDSNQRIAPIVFMLAFCADCALRFRTSQQKSSVVPIEEEPVAHERPAAIAGVVRPAIRVPHVGGTSRGVIPTEPDARRSSGRRGRLADRDVWGGWGLESSAWGDDPYANEVWGQQTMVLPAWQFQAGDVDQWKVDSAHLPAIGRGMRARRRSADAQQAQGQEQGQVSSSSGHDRGARAGEKQAGEEMLRRAPTSFIWNQIYAMWFFASGFLLSIVITRGLSQDEYGIYAILTTIISTLTFLCAFGMEDAATVFLARIHARDGAAATGTMIRDLLVSRVLLISIAGLCLAVGLVVAAPVFVHLGITPSFFNDAPGGSLGIRALFIGLYMIGGSISTLQIAFFSALLRSRVVLVVGAFTQIISVGGVFVLLKVGWGLEGVFAALGVASWITVFAYLIPLRSLLFARGTIRSVRRGEMRKLMVSAWLTNVSNTALGKQMDIMLMTAFAIGTASIGYYNLAYQLGSIIGVVLISGLGGVGMAAMSAALSTGGVQRLLSMWRANIMLQVMLAVPLQTICFVFADQIVTVLYGSNYAGAALLLRIFLGFTMLGRLIGGGASQSALYVIGKQRSVVVLRWTGLIINVVLDITLIQVYGPLGAMIATGFSQVWVALMEYFLLRFHVGTKYPLAFAVRVASVATFASLLLLWWAPGGFIGLVVEFLLFGILFALGLWITNTSDANDLTELMLANPRLKAILTRVGRLAPGVKVASAPA